MNVQFIGPSVYIQAESNAALLVSAQEMLQLVQWGLDNEVALRARVTEAEKAKEQPMDTGGGEDE